MHHFIFKIYKVGIRDKHKMKRLKKMKAISEGR